MEDVFLDAFDTMDDAPSTPRASMNGGVAAAPSRSPDIIAEEELSTSPFHDLTPQQQVASVVAEGGVPFELCCQSWTQTRHVRRMEELLNATKERVAQEKNVDRAAAIAERRRQSIDAGSEPPEMSMYDQAKGVIGRMQLGQDITKFELPANFLTPFSATQATEDVLTVISGTERGLEDWKSLSDVQNLAPMERFLAVLKVYLDMEALRAEEGTGGGTKTAFILPPMKKPINSVLGETHRVRVGNIELVAEQVSHHPPITCWELEHEAAGLKITGNLSPSPSSTAPACRWRCEARQCSSFATPARRTRRPCPTCTSGSSAWAGRTTRTSVAFGSSG